MAAEGAQVSVFDVNADNAEAVAKEVDGHFYAVDVTDFESMATAMLDAAEKMDGLSLLYNNAGGSTLAPHPRLRRRGMAAHRRPQPHRRVPRVQSRCAADPEERRRGHRLDGFDLRYPARGGRGAVLRGQGGRHRTHRERGARIRALDPRQRGVAGDDPHAADRAAPRSTRDRPRGTGSAPRRRSSASARPPTSPTWWCSSAPTSPVSSPARTSWSTAG